MPQHRPAHSRRAAAFACWCLVAALGTAQAAPDLTVHSDFGRADILLTAASILQSGSRQTARIDQTTDITATDRLLYPVGSGNIAEIEQSGSDHEAFILQIGNLHRARVVQSDMGNTVDAVQLGVDNWLNVSQSGMGNLLNSHQEGVGNRITLSQAGGNSATLREVGDRNEINITQVLGGAAINLNLVGNDQRVTIVQP